jgi:hypothetical protein
MVNLKTNDELQADINFNLRLFILFISLTFILGIMTFFSHAVYSFILTLLSSFLALLFDNQRNADLIRLEIRTLAYKK